MAAISGFSCFIGSSAIDVTAPMLCINNTFRQCLHTYHMTPSRSYSWVQVPLPLVWEVINSQQIPLEKNFSPTGERCQCVCSSSGSRWSLGLTCAGAHRRQGKEMLPSGC